MPALARPMVRPAVRVVSAAVAQSSTLMPVPRSAVGDTFVSQSVSGVAATGSVPKAATLFVDSQFSILLNTETPSSAFALPSTGIATTQTDTIATLTQTTVTVVQKAPPSSSTRPTVISAFPFLSTGIVITQTNAIAAQSDAIAAQTDTIAAQTDVIAAQTDATAAQTDATAAQTDAIVTPTQSTVTVVKYTLSTLSPPPTALPTSSLTHAHRLVAPIVGSVVGVLVVAILATLAFRFRHRRRLDSHLESTKEEGYSSSIAIDALDDKAVSPSLRSRSSEQASLPPASPRLPVHPTSAAVPLKRLREGLAPSTSVEAPLVPATEMQLRERVDVLEAQISRMAASGTPAPWDEFPPAYDSSRSAAL